MIGRRMCDFFTTIMIAGVLYSGCLTPVNAQNTTCATRPVGDSSNACASTAFVQNAVGAPPLTQNHIFVGNSSNLAADFGTSALFATSTVLTLSPIGTNLGLLVQAPNSTPDSISATATLARFYDGSVGNPHTANTPTVSISRVDALNSAGFLGNAPALYINTTATGSGIGNPNSSAIVANATQNGVGDIVGIATNVTQSGTGSHTAYGAFFAALATSANSQAIAVQSGVNSLVDTTWSPSTFLGIGWAVSYDTACNGPTSHRCTAAYVTRNGGNVYDVGFVAMQQSILTNAFEDDSSSITSFKVTGTHTNGFDTRGATVTTPFASTGFSVNNSGALTITNGFNINGLTSGIATLVAQSVAGSSTATLGTNTGTVVVTATSPLAINATTGNITCTSCLIANQNITLSGDVTGSGTTAITTTLATVNTNVGTFGSATQSAQVTVNGKGLTTAATNVTITPAIGSITGLGTGVGTALAINVGSAGAFVTFNGALGTPSSGTLTNATGLPTTGLTGTLQAAQEPAHTGDVTNTAGSLALTLATTQSAVHTWSAVNTFSSAVGGGLGTGAVVLSAGGLSVAGAIYSAGNQVVVNAAQSALYLRKSDNTSGFIIGRSISAGDAQDFFIYDNAAALVRLSIASTGGVSIGTSADPGLNNFAAARYFAGSTGGLASKTCTINTTNVTTGITITITGGLVTGTTTC